MKKPDLLRAAINAALPDLAANPDRLLMFVQNGKNVPGSKGSLSWRYEYTLNLVVIDFTADPDNLMLSILAWCETHQPDLFVDDAMREDGFTFEAEILDNKAVDLDIKLKLTETVAVQRNGAEILSVTHLDEVRLVDEDGPLLREVLLSLPDES